MSLLGLYVALAAASGGGQALPLAPAIAPAAQREAAVPVALPVNYRLPAGSQPQPIARRDAARKDAGLQQITAPPMPRDPFETPTAQLWPSNSPIRMNLVGVKLGWNL